MARIMAKDETIVLRVPTTLERSQHAILAGVGLPVLALEVPHLFGFYYPSGDSFWLAIKILTGVGLVFMIVQYWRHRAKIMVTDRQILVRRGISWRRHDAMDLGDIATFDYNPISRTLMLYGNKRILKIRCKINTSTRIIVAIADAT